MKKNINDLICGLLNDGKFTRKELNFTIYQAEQNKIDKTTLLDGIMEEYLSFVVENGGVTWKVKSNIRLLSKVFNITYDKLLFELEGGINSYIKEEKKKGWWGEMGEVPALLVSSCRWRSALKVFSHHKESFQGR